MKRLAAVAFLSFLLAPAPYGVAINYQTRECAGYWGGDEFIDYSVPAGWSVYYPDENMLIHTELGTYTWYPRQGPEAFCNEVGYPFVSENIGKDRGVRTELKTPAEILLKVVFSYMWSAVLTLLLGLFGLTALGYGLYRALRKR